MSRYYTRSMSGKSSNGSTMSITKNVREDKKIIGVDTILKIFTTNLNIWQSTNALTQWYLQMHKDTTNYCVNCGSDMGRQNPRQLCGKTFCINEDIVMQEDSDSDSDFKPCFTDTSESDITESDITDTDITDTDITDTSDLDYESDTTDSNSVI